MTAVSTMFTMLKVFPSFASTQLEAVGLYK